MSDVGIRRAPPEAGPATPAPAEDPEALRRRLQQAVARVCPAWLSASQEDIVQAAMLRVLESDRKSGGMTPHGASYLHKVAYSAAVDEMRRHFRRHEVQAGETPAWELAPAEMKNPEEMTVSREIDRGITACLSRLQRPRRLAVTLFLQGYTVPEAGRLMGWTTKKTEHLVARGLEGLRACLSRKGLQP